MKILLIKMLLMTFVSFPLGYLAGTKIRQAIHPVVMSKKPPLHKPAVISKAPKVTLVPKKPPVHKPVVISKAPKFTLLPKTPPAIIKAPEITFESGITSIALLTGVLLLLGERFKRRRS